ncbi:MAG: Tim44 domain-containing protein [Rhodospirillaceae bacterium]|nr:Tim44 domain-containing protein [Rhodospirillaceae bacterium]
MDSDLIITLIFAAIAVFVIVKLRSVLGTRTGFEKKNEPYAPADNRDKVIPLPERRQQEAPTGSEAGKQPMDAGVAAIRRADPSFDLDGFLDGAKMAFEMIVTAFAKGDEKTLEPLLAPPVFESFAADIRRRREAGETRETTVAAIRSVRLHEARLEGREARVAVVIVSEQSNVTRDSSGAVIDGDPKATETVSDLWTFARDTRSRDPNWQLVETAAAE